MYDLKSHSLMITVAEQASNLCVYRLGPDETENDHDVIQTRVKSHELLALDYAVLNEQLVDLMEFCDIARKRDSYAQVPGVCTYYLGAPPPIGPVIIFGCEAADAIYHYLAREFEKLHTTRKHLVPSDFVCMKMVTRLKELRKADPAKARTNHVDITWMRELYLAAKEAEQSESRR